MTNVPSGAAHTDGAHCRPDEVQRGELRQRISEVRSGAQHVAPHLHHGDVRRGRVRRVDVDVRSSANAYGSAKSPSMIGVPRSSPPTTSSCSRSLLVPLSSSRSTGGEPLPGASSSAPPRPSGRHLRAPPSTHSTGDHARRSPTDGLSVSSHDQSGATSSGAVSWLSCRQVGAESGAEPTDRPSADPGRRARRWSVAVPRRSPR